jgi:hypothetical protein
VPHENGSFNAVIDLTFILTLVSFYMKENISYLYDSKIHDYIYIVQYILISLSQNPLLVDGKVRIEIVP